MIAMREVTNWLPVYNHTYLFDGSSAVAYIKSGDTQPIYFKKPLNIDQRRRKFVALAINPFNQVVSNNRTWRVKSKNNTYIVTLEEDKFSCSCVGFQYHRKCRHANAVAEKVL